MKKRLGPIAIVLAAGAAAAGLASPSTGAGTQPHCLIHTCGVDLTATGPSPSTLEMSALHGVLFRNRDSISHTVVFANGLCWLTVAAGQLARCGRFVAFVGNYAYTVDGKFPGTVVTMPLGRSVSLTARTHTIRVGTRVTLHGQVTRTQTGAAPPPPVVVLARHNSKQPFEPVATARTRGSHQTTYRWRLEVKPKAATAYIAEVTAQRLCYYPASRCAHPQGQVWVNAKTRPFTVRIRQEGPR